MLGVYWAVVGRASAVLGPKHLRTRPLRGQRPGGGSRFLFAVHPGRRSEECVCMNNAPQIPDPCSIVPCAPLPSSPRLWEDEGGGRKGEEGGSEGREGRREGWRGRSNWRRGQFFHPDMFFRAPVPHTARLPPKNRSRGGAGHEHTYVVGTRPSRGGPAK